MDCIKDVYFKPPIVKRFSQSVNISTAWGSLYTADTVLNITDCGDLTAKDVVVQVRSRYGYSVITSVDLIAVNEIKLSFMRATVYNGDIYITVFIYDR